MKMANFFAVLMAVLIVSVFMLVYLNRASSEVVGAAVPVAVAAVSALALVFAFGKPAALERAFPVAFIAHKTNRAPIVLPHRPFDMQALSMFSQAGQGNPKFLEDPKFGDFGGGPLYHYYFQKAIINWLASNYWGTWRTRVQRFQAGWVLERTGPAADASSFSSRTLSKEELQHIFKHNPFANVPAFGPGTLTLPPHTQLTITEPDHNIRQGEIGEIRMKNWLCDVRIKTRDGMKSVGAGPYTGAFPICSG